MQPARRLPLIVATLMSACASPPKAGPPPTLAFDADLEVVGPAVENWRLNYVDGGAAKTEISWLHGEMKGQFYVSQESRQRVLDSIRENAFFDLPANIHASVMSLDAPDLQLTISVDGRQHKVRVYDPRALREDPGFQRFHAVLEAVLSILPVRPSGI